MKHASLLRFWLVTVVAMPGLLTGCDGPTDTERGQQIDFRIDPDSYGLGDTATLTLTNHGPHPSWSVEALLCFLEMEQGIDGSWESVDPPPSEPVPECRLLQGLTPLEPGESFEREVPIEAGLFEPGAEYRFMIEQAWFVNGDRVGVELRSDPFTVRD